MNDTPLLEVQSADWTETARHKYVDDVPAGIGMMKSRLPVKVTGSVNIRIPRGGTEFDYRGTLRRGEMVTVRRVDLDAIADAICHFTDIKYSDNFSEDRTCTVSFEGALPPAGDE
jgi:hypothetical protein